MANFVFLNPFLVDHHDGIAGAMRTTEDECREKPNPDALGHDRPQGLL